MERQKAGVAKERLVNEKGVEKLVRNAVSDLVDQGDASIKKGIDHVRDKIT